MGFIESMKCSFYRTASSLREDIQMHTFLSSDKTQFNGTLDFYCFEWCLSWTKKKRVGLDVVIQRNEATEKLVHMILHVHRVTFLQLGKLIHPHSIFTRSSKEKKF